MLAQYYIRFLALFTFVLIPCSVHITAQGLNNITCLDNVTDVTNFENNRDQLLGALQTGANNSDGFYITSVNPGQSSQLFGLIMCYIDINWDMCSSCLNFSISNATFLCPNSSYVILNFDWCFLRYSSINFTSKLLQNQQPKCLGPREFGDSTTLNNTVHSLLQYVKNRANTSTSRYSYAKMTDTGNQSLVIYLIEQCTRDLTVSNCDLCLEYAINRLGRKCSVTNGHNAQYRLRERVIYVGCYIRYSDHELPILSKDSVAKPTWPDISSTPNDSRNVAPSTSPEAFSTPNELRNDSRWRPILAGVSAACGSVIILAVSIWLWRQQKQASTVSRTDDGMSTTSTTPLGAAQLFSNINHLSEFSFFELDTLRLATKNFSEENKLGHGGFGSVYKGSLGDGKAIAVKKLSAYSRQGLAELKNEVKSLGQVKHRNLVQLVGCCIQENKKLLCYELLPNGSLDKFLFANDPIRQEKLNWKTRYIIIQGISSGLHYLHEKSTVRIVHRDLKPSNILLDTDMTPKISDFGLARLFKEDQTHLETSNPAGTLGYMAPECFLQGTYSVKSDVYSFGVLLLEIVTGKRICSFADSAHASSLISYVQQHAIKGEYEVLRDPVLQDVRMEEFRKCIHIGLQCVQEDPIERPHMKDVEVMLSGYSTALPPLPELRQPLRMISMISDSSERTI